MRDFIDYPHIGMWFDGIEDWFKLDLAAPFKPEPGFSSPEPAATLVPDAGPMSSTSPPVTDTSASIEAGTEPAGPFTVSWPVKPAPEPLDDLVWSSFAGLSDGANDPVGSVSGASGGFAAPRPLDVLIGTLAGDAAADETEGPLERFADLVADRIMQRLNLDSDAQSAKTEVGREIVASEPATAAAGFVNEFIYEPANNAESYLRVPDEMDDMAIADLLFAREASHLFDFEAFDNQDGSISAGAVVGQDWFDDFGS